MESNKVLTAELPIFLIIFMTKFFPKNKNKKNFTIVEITFCLSYEFDNR